MKNETCFKKTALLADYLRKMCFIEQLRNTSQPAMSQQKENCASQSTPKELLKVKLFGTNRFDHHFLSHLN